jgi:hypothetical protein
LLRVNGALLQPLQYDSDGYDAGVWSALVQEYGWHGPAIASLQEELTDRPPVPEDVEKLLVRIAVRYGVPLGNSQFASQ